MQTHNPAAQGPRRGFLRTDDCNLADLAIFCATPTDPAGYPHAARVEKGVLVYDCPALARHLHDAAFRDALMAEWAEAFASGPGVIVLQGAEPDLAMLDRASDIFREVGPTYRDRIIRPIIRSAIRSTVAEFEAKADDHAAAEHRRCGCRQRECSDPFHVLPLYPGV